jgi:hypothetical protein
MMLAITIGWIALAYKFFEANPGFLHFGFSARNVSTQGTKADLYDFAHMSLGGRVVTTATQGLGFAVWGGACYGIVRRLRSGVSEVEASVLLFAPFVFLIANGYGGEGVLRAYLFSLPAAAYLIASALLPRRSSWQRTGARAITFVVLCAIAGLSVIASFGHDQFNILSPLEVEAARTLETSAPPGSQLYTIGASWPRNSTADYPNLTLQVTLVDEPTFIHRAMAPDEADRIGAKYAPDGTHKSYLVTSRSGIAFMNTFGVLPDGQYEVLVDQIRNSPHYRLWLENDDATIWEILPTTTP